MCVRVCGLQTRVPNPREAGRQLTPQCGRHLGAAPGTVLCSSASCRGGASPTMQFFKSSLILLFAFRVVFCHGGDRGPARGSAPGLAEGGLQEEAGSPF